MLQLRLLAATLALAAPLGAFAAESIQDRFRSMDSNHDGRVSAEEHTAAAQKMFKQLDVDLDGRVTVEEMRLTRKAMEEPASEEEARQAIAAMDRNGDGKVDAEEHLAAADALFKRADANADGFVTEDELQQAAGPAAN
ncbi:calcium-binding protein CML [Pseudoxanthomonas sp. GM95]|uniref:EF-hand domain-containing protein n=1 Tax=Pseudoxanthomonas sp. GM95 TaxID=1881043 RepID=UPI0008B9F6F0|nr:EF-hand domain-containing protein [Pseudoxanthomonas sp. GM95]SEM08297.1 calcium-binding protein CML [Pseudoxanthomonas sp. GM95]